jgi:hypothetical protein
MKNFFKILLFALTFSVFLTTGCKRVLEETNRSNILPDYFTTPGGIDAAIIGAYSNLRNWYCQEGMCYNSMIGTDEHIPGFGTSGNFHTYTVQTGDGSVQSIWDWSYRSINSCNGVLENVTKAGLSAADQVRVSGEAKFLRAYYYFMLVQTFGDVTLSTVFASSPTTEAKSRGD